MARMMYIAVAIMVILASGSVPAATARQLVSTSSPALLDAATIKCGNVTIVCSDAISDADKWIPWIASMSSVVLFTITAVMRVWTLCPEKLGARHMFFMWSLILGLGYHILWFWYFFQCSKGQTTFPVRVGSILAGAIHIMLVVVVKFKLPTNVSTKRLYFLILMCLLSIVGGGLLFHTKNIATIGWLGLVLGVLSNYCRRESTDYEEFNWKLFVTSIGLTIAGFLWLYHPNLCVARQYKITSYLLSGARGIEVLMWMSPKIRLGIRRAEGREVAEQSQFGFVLVKRRPPRRIPMIRLGWNTLK